MRAVCARCGQDATRMMACGCAVPVRQPGPAPRPRTTGVPLMHRLLVYRHVTP